MISMQKLPGIFLFLVLSSVRMFPQALPVSSGGTATGEGGSATFTAGLPAYVYLDGTSGNATPGLQHAYEISGVSALPDARTGVSVFVSPNPVKDLLIITFSDPSVLPLTATLYDASGALVSQWDISADHFAIDVSHLNEAAYFLKISGSGREINTFKILKK
jgi:hypothetical protein